MKATVDVFAAEADTGDPDRVQEEPAYLRTLARPSPVAAPIFYPSVYATTFAATRHHPALDGTLFTMRAHADAEALARRRSQRSFAGGFDELFDVGVPVREPSPADALDPAVARPWPEDYRATLTKIPNLTSHGEITCQVLYAILILRTIFITECPIAGEPRALQLLSSTRLNPTPRNARTSTPPRKAHFPTARRRQSLFVFKGTETNNWLTTTPTSCGVRWLGAGASIHHAHYNGTVALAITTMGCKYNTEPGTTISASLQVLNRSRVCWTIPMCTRKPSSMRTTPTSASTHLTSARGPVHCPLYVGGGDPETNAAKLDAALERVVGIATSWKAIVLIDEADVFLERRTPSATPCLRPVEYYRGIVSLTTNHVSTLPRFHVAPHFGGLSVPAKSATILCSSSRNATSKGQIKNACCTAKSLALSRNEPLGVVYFAEAMDAMEQFTAAALGRA
ncbi:hypothetical protein C8Q76DRAFT_695114 [Earliella scabrosa]|nr:hypothetical protein C8Q76DRAFT_695114 [Earliella scabrosa]